MFRPGVLPPLAALFLLLAAGAEGLSPAPDSARGVEFDRDVLPILGAKCLGCHSGPEPKARLDLLSRKSATATARSGERAVVPGDPGESRLLAVVDGSDGELRMPPRGDALTAEETLILREWIASGAGYSPAADALAGKPWHWAYRAPTKPAVPEVADPAWRANPIDRFVLAALEREGLAHAPPAARGTLARRLSLSLTGLLPEPDAAAAFERDTAPDAVARYVDGLLASPHYGERMARLWLDLARYADTNGYEKDDRRSMWPWRDWVIAAFNANMPFDRFALEQLAGDLVPDASLRSRIATGFCRNTMINEEGGVDPEEFRVEAVHDRVATTAGVFLGATLACARCHDHKFDPFSIDDYYSFFAYFDQDLPDATQFSNSEQRASGAKVGVPPPGSEPQYESLLESRAALAKVLATPSDELAAAQQAWEAARRAPSAATPQAARATPWRTLVPSQAVSEGGAELKVLPDGTVEVGGAAPELDTYRLEFPLPAGGARALRLEVLTGATGAVGRADDGNFVLSELAATWTSADPKQGGPLIFTSARADYEQRSGDKHWSAKHAIDSNPKTGWAAGGATRAAHELVLQGAGLFGAGSGSVLRVTLAQRDGVKRTLARLRLSCSPSEDRSLLEPLSAEQAAILAREPAQRSADESAQLAQHFREVTPLLAEEQVELARVDAELARMASVTTLVMQETLQPRTTHVMRKGNFLDRGDETPARVPAVFGRTPEDVPKNRLGLARWIASRENPLFARVLVNHVWTLHFGRGLVATSDDFGTQGDPPSHPELLDWLACEFAESGFDVKALHKKIATSQTFLQDSRFAEASAERDPANRWLARGPRFRLEAEAVRDAALCASGLLSRRVGGPSVFPPQPPGIWTMIYSTDKYVESTGPDRYRRGLYTFWRRTAPFPTAMLFDAPSRELSCARRPRTNTPLQALAGLNDPQFVELAVALARRMLRDSGSADEAAIERGFRICLARSPSREEAATLLELFRAQRARYAQDAAAARELLANGPADSPEDADPAGAAACTVVANVLLNLDEMLSLE